MTTATKHLTAAIEGDYLVIRVPLNASPSRSATGKTLVVASSHGNKETEVQVQGQSVYVGVNALSIPPGDIFDVRPAERPRAPHSLTKTKVAAMSGRWTLAEILNELSRQMDPQACLDRATEAINRGDRVEAQVALDDYASWRARGGFEPADGDRRAEQLWQRLHGTLKG